KKHNKWNDTERRRAVTIPSAPCTHWLPALPAKLQFISRFKISLQAQLSIAKDERMCYNLPNLIV
ncbi:MAG: hypothetical protein UHS47_13575, partial [Oscillospiraceae bacterium]|nr:hypothetical protein [Oscillospiraceae bacterium]